MKERNWGRIIFVSSESGVQIPAEMIHYGTTKTAQLAVARGLAETCAGTNVTVNSVLPGPTASEGVTEFVGQLAEENEMSREEFEKGLFQKRPTDLSLEALSLNRKRSPMSLLLFAARSPPQSMVPRFAPTAA